MHTWIDIATLTKKRNAQGRFVARCQANLLLCLKPDIQVAFVPPLLDVPRYAVIADVTQVGDSTVEITFEYVDGPWERGQEEQLVGHHMLVPRAQVQSDEASLNAMPLVGFEVFDNAQGLLGTVKDIVVNPGQSLLVVERLQGGSDLLIPAVQEIVYEIDEDADQIRVDLPSGLLEL